MDTQTTLVATLGGKPQLVTFLLDLLLARGEAIDQVVIVYIRPYPRSLTAFQRLVGEFIGNQYAGRPCILRGFPIQAGGSDLEDIRMPDEVEVVRQNIHGLLGELKEQSQCIHLGLSGGRRVISMIALAAAMQYLTPLDRLWHIIIPSEFAQRAGDGAIMHAPPDAAVRLIPVPFVPWVAYFPGLEPLLKRSSQEMGEASLGWLREEERGRCARVWEMLTNRQREILEAIAAGLSRKEVAQKLGIAVATVDSHRDNILEQCCLVWEARSGEEFDVRFLQRYFGPFLSGKKQV